jgi:hypothetical protein
LKMLDENPGCMKQDFVNQYGKHASKIERII